MLKISRLETRLQEIIFLLTITFSLSIAVGGLFYLTLSPQNFLNAAGMTGSYMISSGFSGFGLTYFFFVVFTLHMGHLTLGTALYVRDIVRGYRMYFKNFAIYFTVMLLISSFLTVLEAYNHWESTQLFANGFGGWFGSLIGGMLFKSFGLYGALVILFCFTSILGISAGFMEIVHSFYVMKDIFKELFKNIRTHGPRKLKMWAESVIDFIDQKPQYASGQNSTQSTFKRDMDVQSYHRNNWVSSPYQGGRLATDHFHTPDEGLIANEQEDTKQEVVSREVEERLPLQNRQEEIVHREEVIDSPDIKKKKVKRTPKSDSVTVEEVSVEAVQKEEVKVEKEDVEISAWTKRYKKVDPCLLEKPEKKVVKSDKEINELCNVLSERLESFGIKGKILAAHQGVTLTMFEFQPAAGMKLSKIQSLSDDLALVLGAKAIRILTPIPGKTTVGIEVPNKEVATLRFSEMVATCMKKKSLELPVPLGVDVYNNPHVNDLTKMPHLLVSGTTGSGKSVFMNSLISGLIFHKSPKELRFLMIDPKMIELSPYNGIPHLLKPVITDVEEAKNLLLWAEKEMDRRYQIFADMQSKNIVSFNQAVKKGSKRAIEGRLNKKIDWNFEEMPYIVIVIDELADLMLTQRQEVERPITRIAQKARAAGIHMVMATQRPSSDIVTGLIKTNFPTRVSFKVSSNIDSRTILDQPGAEKLLGNGDMLYMAQGKAIERLQGSFMTEDEVKKVVRAVSSQATKSKK